MPGFGRVHVGMPALRPGPASYPAVPGLRLCRRCASLPAGIDNALRVQYIHACKPGGVIDVKHATAAVLKDAMIDSWQTNMLTETTCLRVTVLH